MKKRIQKYRISDKKMRAEGREEYESKRDNCCGVSNDKTNEERELPAEIRDGSPDPFCRSFHSEREGKQCPKTLKCDMSKLVKSGFHGDLCAYG